VHKAAGSSVINQAIANGETLYPNHKNGNPCSPDGEEIPVWEFEENELSAFIDGCEAGGITFVATEWGSPNYQVLHNDTRVVLVTCIREPWSRLISNYNYDYYLGYSDSPSLSSYLTADHRIRMDNYLVRVFSDEFHSDTEEIRPETFDSALDNLKLFDLVLIAERDGDLNSHLFKALGWEGKSVDSHQTFGNLWTLSSLLLGLRIIAAMNYLLKRKRKVTEDDRRAFDELSEMEQSFYRKATEDCVRGRLHPLHSH
jgi:hypothetical protein